MKQLMNKNEEFVIKITRNRETGVFDFGLNREAINGMDDISLKNLISTINKSMIRAIETKGPQYVEALKKAEKKADELFKNRNNGNG